MSRSRLMKHTCLECGMLTRLCVCTKGYREFTKETIIVLAASRVSDAKLKNVLVPHQLKIFQCLKAVDIEILRAAVEHKGDSSCTKEYNKLSVILQYYYEDGLGYLYGDESANLILNKGE